MIIVNSSIISYPTSASGIIVYCTSASSENLIIFGDRFLFFSCPVCFIRRNELFAANGHMVQIHHAGEQTTHWDIQNRENSSLTG